VHLGFFEELVPRELARHEPLGERVGDERAFAHHVLQVAGAFEAGAGRGRERVFDDGFDVEGRAAHGRPCEAHRDAGGGGFVEAVGGEDRGADVVFEVRTVDGHVDGVGDFEGHPRGVVLFVAFADVTDDVEGGFAVHFLDLLLQVPDAGFAAVGFDEFFDGAFVQVDGDVFQTGELLRGRGEVAFCNGHFFVGDVAGQFDHLHAVEEGSGDGVRHVGGADEEHLGEVDGDVHVVVEEGVVLFRIEEFEQGG
ncbi:MAG: hypothetical protein Q9211_001097, partial [Gyalolechia sp. 1 TL-2023]